jgi:hypothetical protein
MARKILTIMKIPALLLIICLIFQTSIIGFLSKTMTKISIAFTDINKFKNYNIELVHKKAKEELQKEYTEVLYIWPFGLKLGYTIAKNLDIDKVIKDIESLDKKTLYAKIDSISNKSIADNFRRQIGLKMQESNAGRQLESLWLKITSRETKRAAE